LLTSVHDSTSAGVRSCGNSINNRLIPTCVHPDEVIPSLHVLCSEGVRSMVSILISILNRVDVSTFILYVLKLKM
jgi:hypothetical protein